MAFYVVITEQCQDDADHHGLGTRILKLKESIEKVQNLTGFRSIRGTPFLKRGLSNLRLIAYHVPVADDELILFLRVLPRGSKDYERFLDAIRQDEKRAAQQFVPYDQDDLKQLHAERTRESIIHQPPPPNEEEQAWLYEVLQVERHDDDIFVLETEDWVKKMKGEGMLPFLALYHQILEEMVDTTRLHPARMNTECRVYWDNSDRYGIVYLYRPDLNFLLLLRPIQRSDDIESLFEKCRERLRGVGEEKHDILRVAARSYPLLMVLDEKAWLAIEKDEEANLALSPEEAGLLNSIRRAGAEGELGYPLFINGRAGSGKSTMLQYLFADYVDFALRRNTRHLPLYLTYSRDLLDQARNTVQGLLTAHHARLLERGGQISEKENERIKEMLNKTFRVFHDFLYSLLPSEVQEQLPKDRYVNYAEFRRLWERKFARRPEARRMPPDLAWHVIRSYIKGIRSSYDDELTPEEFSELPRRNRSVSSKTYKQIYERVWRSWYKPLCEEEGYWDDQDLAAHVLEKGVAANVDSAAIFCDEAQDFTPIELDIIFQLSLFGRRSLQPEELRRVPIVFAGDPLQTINPTGFRWEAVKDDFRQRFHAVLNPHRRVHINPSYRELHFNYRSNPGIVKFCNLVQLVRAALLEDRSIQPQKAWWVDSPVRTVWFPLDDAQTQRELQQRPEIVKLVNCEEGEETAYVRNDPVLRNLQKESEGIYRNVLSPIRAKGLEFSTVVLYRFGETAPPEFERLLKGEINLDNPEERLPLEYFLNRLYVAASRAKHQLIIVDNRDIIQSFWRFATEPSEIDRLIERARISDKWRDPKSIAHLFRGRPEEWSGQYIDPHEQAREYAEQGKRKRDPYLLRQAALAYRSIDDEVKARECLALAAEFEGKFREAGDRYRDLGKYDEAFRCYWRGREWQSLCNLAARDARWTSRLESRIADYMAHNEGLPDSSLLRELRLATGDDDWLGEAKTDATWQGVFAELAARLSKAAKAGDRTIAWTEVHHIFRRLSEYGIPVNENHRAMIAYTASDFGEAVRLWERSGDTNRGEYYRAKAHTTSFPDNLLWLQRVKDHAEILRRWREKGQTVLGSNLTEKVARAIADAALQERDLPLAAEMLKEYPDRYQVANLLEGAIKAGEEQILDEMANIAVQKLDHDQMLLSLRQVGGLLESAVEVGDGELVKTTAIMAARYLVRTRRWDAAISAAEWADFSAFSKSSAADIRSALEQYGGRAAVLKAVVQELATSKNLQKATAENQKKVADFLQRYFIKGQGNDEYGITPQVAGAAIERAGRIVDALQYYENLERSASTSEMKRFAAERLIKNSERYAEYLISRGDKGKAQQYKLKAKHIREQYGLEDRAIPEYPVLGAKLEGAGLEQWQRGPFKIVLSRSHGRLRIEHTERFETVTVDARKRRLLGDAEFSQLEAPSDSQSIVWQVENWNMTITLLQGRTTKCYIRFDGDTFEIPFD